MPGKTTVNTARLFPSDETKPDPRHRAGILNLMEELWKLNQ